MQIFWKVQLEYVFKCQINELMNTGLCWTDPSINHQQKIGWAVFKSSEDWDFISTTMLTSFLKTTNWIIAAVLWFSWWTQIVGNKTS